MHNQIKRVGDGVDPINVVRDTRELAQRRDYWFGCQRANVAEAERYLDSDLNVVLRVGRSSRKNVAVIRGLRPHEFVEFGRYGA
jgi:hypothetical protein